MKIHGSHIARTAGRAVAALTALFWAFNAVAAGCEESFSDVLRRLDKVIDERKVYTARREGQFSEIRRRIASGNLSPEEKLSDCGRLFEEYCSFQTDSAVRYALLKKEMSLVTGDSLKILEADLNLAQIYSIAGLNHDAFIILDRLPKEQFSPFLYRFYYNVLASLYENSYYTIDNLELKRMHYDQLHDAYTELLSRQSPATDGCSYYYTKANLLNLEGRHTEARQWLEKYADSLTMNLHNEAIYYYLLAETCISGGGTREEAKRFYAVSAIADLSCGVKEHVSLSRLAGILYTDDGDLDRAYRYLKVSLDDANSCNSQKRIVPVSQIFPIIDNDYQIRRNRQQRNLYIYGTLSTLMVILLIAALGWIYEMHRRSRRINARLSELNGQLKELNSNLNESNIIKQFYIVRYMDFCLSYIDQMDSRLKRISRLVEGNDRNALRKALDTASLARENLDIFYNNFDTTFLHLFPTFVEEYNKLLKPSERIVLKKNDRLNTELRIYALIRLGVTDSVLIARFLHCSLSTVYNNRTCARNKASVDRNSFEACVARIGLAETSGNDALFGGGEAL